MESKSHTGVVFYMFSVLKLRNGSGDVGVDFVRLIKTSLMVIHLKWDLGRFIYTWNRHPSPISRELKHRCLGKNAVIRRDMFSMTNRAATQPMKTS
jgi:hypothetical protein